MCLIAFAWQSHPRYALVVAANRDEFHERPTAAAHWWTDAPVFAGRDLRGGGTWMGMSRGGRFAALTNVRDPASQRADARSRGLLVSDVLDDARTLDEVVASAARERDRYNGFTLLAAEWSTDVDAQRLYAVGSSGDVVALAPGVYGLSNAAIDTPWPKVVAMRDALMRSLDANDEASLIEALFAALSDRRIAADGDLPATGIAREWERALSARFVAMPDYGTRASTIVLVQRNGDVTFVERDVAASSEVVARFALESTTAS